MKNNLLGFKSFYAICAVLTCFQSHAVEEIDLFSLSLEGLGEIKFYTNNKLDISIDDSIAIMNSISRQQIERRGYLTLEDAMAHIPGFFPTRGDSTARLGSRGFIQTNAFNYLLLIDGFPVNSSSSFGLNNQQLLMGLNNVEKIEVQRTANSTLWGNMAGMGIIHVFTRKHNSLNNTDFKPSLLTVNSNYEVSQQRTFTNVLYDKSFNENRGYSLAFNYQESDADWLGFYRARDSKPVLSTGRVNNSEFIYPSTDLTLNVNYDNWTFMGRYADSATGLVYWSSQDKANKGKITIKNKWLQASYEATFANSWKANIDFQFANNTSNFKQIKRVDGSLFNTQLEDHRFNLEGRLVKSGKNYHWLSGINLGLKSFRQDEWSNDIANTVLATHDYNEYAAYSEINYITDKWTLLGGIRYDYSSLLNQEKVAILPRAGIKFKHSKYWSLMYSYNTGLIRPPVPEADIVRNLQGNLIKGVSEAESSSSHDLQVAYRNDQLLTKVTFYRTKFSNKIESIPRQTLSDGVTVGRVNGESLYMEGIEIEYQWDVTESLLAYGNYSNASTEYSDNLVSFDAQTFDLFEISNIISPDKSATGYPKHILNMGFDWKISDGYHLNFHYRHWRGAQAKWSNSPASFKNFSGNKYLDVNLIIDNMIVKGLKFNIFAKNLLDNTAPYPNAVKGGYSEMYGVKYGVGLEYSFEL